MVTHSCWTTIPMLIPLTASFRWINTQPFLLAFHRCLFLWPIGGRMCIQTCPNLFWPALLSVPVDGHNLVDRFSKFSLRLAFRNLAILVRAGWRVVLCGRSVPAPMRAHYLSLGKSHLDVCRPNNVKHIVQRHPVHCVPAREPKTITTSIFCHYQLPSCSCALRRTETSKSH